jgi:hypothetical protein
MEPTYEDLVRLFYPDTCEPEDVYEPKVEKAAKYFTHCLFDPDELPFAAARSFREHLNRDGQVSLSLDGLPALQAYRRTLGKPQLVRANVLAVPRSLAMSRLDEPDTKYDWDALLELNMLLGWDDLTPEWQKFPGADPGVKVPVQLRMREPLIVKPPRYNEDITPGIVWDFNKPMVFGRTHVPYLKDRLGQPGDQFAHVGEQVKFFFRRGVAMSTSATWTPTFQAYNQIVSDARFEHDPLAAS